jgi:NTE family protein
MERMDSLKEGIGLVLGGGGARGLAHIGVLRVLEREGIPVSHVAGTSIGGLIGAVYAAGISMEQLTSEVDNISHVSEFLRLMDVSVSTQGISIKGARIYDYIAGLLGSDVTFSDLQRPLAMVAVDIYSGRQVVLQGGLVSDAVRATISIPGIFASSPLGDYRLVDGGILNNLPVDVGRSLAPPGTPLIAVDVLPDYSANRPGQEPVVAPLEPPLLPGTLQELYQVLMIMISALTSERLKQYPPDVLIRPAIPATVTLLYGFSRAADIVAAGEAAAEAALPQIRTLLSRGAAGGAPHPVGS